MYVVVFLSIIIKILFFDPMLYNISFAFSLNVYLVFLMLSLTDFLLG